MNKDCTVSLVGASKLSQIEDNLKAIDLVKKWTPEIDAKIEALLGNKPDAEWDFKNFNFATKGRREQNLDIQN